MTNAFDSVLFALKGQATPRAAGAMTTSTRRIQRNTRPDGRAIRARFDSQFTTDDNVRHWALADTMSIDAAASYQVRRTLRMRNRYEYHNNGYFSGLADTIVDYTIGVGPTLRVQTGNKKLDKLIQDSFAEWAKEVGLVQRLQMSRLARIYNGESFTLMRTNPDLEHVVKLDLHEIEADQVSSPLFGMYPQQYPDQFFDGVVLDRYGKPQEYHILRQHPGAFGAFVLMGYEYDTWPARNVLHDYRRLRPAQQRGIPELTAVLSLFMKLRRFSTATLTAAEIFAKHPLTLKTTAADVGNTEPVGDLDSQGNPVGGADPMDVIDLDGMSVTVLPDNYELAGVKTEHPTTTFEMFVNANLREIARCSNTPLMFVTLDPAGANMSSSYVVTQPFAKAVQRDRQTYDRLLDRIFGEFTRELQLLGELPADLPAKIPHLWRWPTIGEHADPSKTAAANASNIKSGVGSFAHILNKSQEDPEEVLESNARFLGMTVPEYQKLLRESIFATKGAPPPAAEDAEPTDDATDEQDDSDESDPAEESDDAGDETDDE